MASKEQKLAFVKSSIQVDEEAPQMEQMEEAGPGFTQRAIEAIAGPLGPAFLKGFAKGGHSLMQAFGPLPAREEATEEFVGRDVPQEEIRENLAQMLDVAIPTPKEGVSGAVAGFAERTGQILPTAIGVPGFGAQEALVRSLLGGGAGEAVKQVGGGELAQTLAEMTAFAAPDVAKLSQLKPSQKSLVELGKKFGLSAEELAPALTEESKISNVMARFGSKTGKIQERIGKSSKAIGRIYEGLKGSEGANVPLNRMDSSALISSIDERLADLPARFSKIIADDYQKLKLSDKTGKDLIVFWQALSDQFSKGNHKLGILKEPITAAMQKISPELTNDFVLANKLFKQQAKLASKLAPDIFDKIMSTAKGAGAIIAASFGYYGTVGEIAGLATARRLTSEILTNPRLLNAHRRLGNAFLRGSPVAAERALKDIQPFVRDIDPEIANEIDDIDFSKIFPEKRKIVNQ